MILFHNDYNRICHSAILERMTQTAEESVGGYGIDPHCERAAQLIRKECGREDVAVHFLVGGTQTNMIVICAALRPHQAVISTDAGHIAVHETGAIEGSGHKVVTLPGKDGKLTAQQIYAVAGPQDDAMDPEHMVQPKMVYISNPTEFGTVYTLRELEEISAVCRQCGLYLYVDGARLGYALGASGYDVTLKDMARLCDAFYIGGTKMGTMIGEAVVITNPAIAQDFRYLMKQRGGMLAKGWVIGLQYEVMFEDGLYYRLGTEADRLADKLRSVLRELGYREFVESNTNQIFVVLPETVLQKLSGEFTYAFWERVDQEHLAVRFCTSWASTESEVDALCAALKKYSK